MATLTSPTLQNLITAVRSLLNQPDRNNSFWDDGELTRWLNDAIDTYFVEVCSSNEGLFTTTTDLSIVANTETIALPSDFFELRAVYKKVNNVYEPMPYRNRSDEAYTTDGGSNSITFVPDYYLRGNNLVLRPVPQFSETSGIRLEYIQFPDTLVNGGDVLTSQVSPIFKQLIEMFAVWKAKLKESLTNGNNVHANAETALSSLYKQFQLKIPKRTHQNTYVKPFNPEMEGA